MNSPLALRLVVLLALGPSSIAHAAAPVELSGIPHGWELKLRESIFSKLDYDLSYFERVLALNAQGKWDTSQTREAFKSEVSRASANLLVLKTFAREKDAYLAGRPFTLAAEGATYRTYSNLLAILNMLQSFQREDYAAVIAAEKRVVMRELRDLGVVRGEVAQYYLALQRQYFYLQAAANFHLGADAEAIRWLNRLETDAELQRLKKQLAAEPALDAAAVALAELRLKPLAVMPFENLGGEPDAQWLSKGLAEVLTADLTRLTGLVIVERTQAAKVLGEASLAQRGITEEKDAARLGQLLNADSLLLGSYKQVGPKVVLSIRLVDARAGKVLEATSAEVSQAELFKDARRLTLELLGKLGWVSMEAQNEALSARSPKTETIRDLVKAQGQGPGAGPGPGPGPGPGQGVLTTISAREAKELYAKAIREDPAYANLFAELKDQFKDVTATVAVLPFVNLTGARDDAWMAAGAVEALTTDLPKLKFTVVERSRLKELLGERLTSQMLAPDEAREFGKQLGADFVVMGSVLHQASKLRADVRFVEVRSGVIVASVTVEAANEDFMALLTALTLEIAAHFNEKLSEQTVQQLVARKGSAADFEKGMREELAKESFARNVSPTQAGGRSRVPTWIAAGAAIVGTATAVSGLAVAGGARATAYYYDGLQQVSVDPKLRQGYVSLRDGNAGAANAWSAVAYAGLGVAAVSAGFLIWDELAHRSAPTRLEVVPVVGVGGGKVNVGLAGTF